MPEDRYQGPPGILHGGLTTTLADEIGAWVIIAKLGKFGFTAQLSAKLHKPIRIGTEVEGRARIANDRKRIVDVDVELMQEDEKCMSAELRFVILDEKGKRSGGDIVDLSDEKHFVRDATVKALAAKNTELRLGHVQPTAVFRRVVDFQARCQRLRFIWFERFV